MASDSWRASTGASSHEIVEDALTILRNLAHRGATGADEQTGDGAGILLQIPHGFFARECRALGIDLPGPGGYAVGTLFLSAGPQETAHIESHCARSPPRRANRCWGGAMSRSSPSESVAWRAVPCRRSGQVFIARTVRNTLEYARALYRIRRRLHWEVQAAGSR